MRRKELKALIDEYIAEHFTGDEILDYDLMEDNFCSSIKFENCFSEPQFLLPRSEKIFDFDKIFKQTESETFSEMLVRLIKESGKKPSEIYRRADIDRQIFSRIKLNKDYQPSKDTAIAFAIALKLDLPTTKKLLETAGFALSNASKRDIIISFFIESKIFSVRKLNDTFHDYGQPILLKRE